MVCLSWPATISMIDRRQTLGLKCWLFNLCSCLVWAILVEDFSYSLLTPCKDRVSADPNWLNFVLTYHLCEVPPVQVLSWDRVVLHRMTLQYSKMFPGHHLCQCFSGYVAAVSLHMHHLIQYCRYLIAVPCSMLHRSGNPKYITLRLLYQTYGH